MAKKIQLSIPKPCHENWDAMSPVEKGKFCGSCQKEVVDFSRMSDRQVAEFFKKPSTGSVCGRFMTDQLNREIEIPRKRIPWLRYFFQIILPAFFFSYRANAQIGKVAVKGETTRIPVDRDIRTLGMILPTTIKPECKDTTGTKGDVQFTKVSRIKVNGKVVDINGNVIPSASVSLLFNGKILAADEQGKFVFITQKDQAIELEVTAVGYQKEYYIYPFSLQYSAEVDIAIQMKPAPKEMPEVVLTAMGMTRPICLTGSASVIMGGVISGVTPDTSVITKPVDPVDPDPAKILFYPNPIYSGQELHISLIDVEEGYYKWQLLDISGKLVQDKDIWIDSEARVVDIDLPMAPAGTYLAILVNRKTGKRYSEKIIVL